MKQILRFMMLVLCLPAVVWAQTPTGGIDGTITDPSGGVIPGATVTVTELATSRAINLATNEAGRYSVRNLLPGKYNIRIEAPGFAAKVVENVSVSSGQVVNGDQTLQIGGTQQVVQVAAAAVAVDTTRQTVDGVVTEKDIKDLPLFGGEPQADRRRPGGPVREGQDEGFFGTDLNGDGGTGTTPRGDILPGIDAGQFGRAVKNFSDLNAIIQAFNSAYAGQLTEHGKALVAAGLFTEAQLKKLGAVVPAIPLVPANNPNPWHNYFTTDLRVDRPINLKVTEAAQFVPFVDFFNLFNHAPVGTYGGLTGRYGALNYDYANAPVGARAADLDITRGRIASGRRLQFGFRFNF